VKQPEGRFARPANIFPIEYEFEGGGAAIS
jgi:hypothetical protein